jgi:hypothetical protein
MEEPESTLLVGMLMDSYGNDCQPGGDGENADIGNREASSASHT